METKRGGGGGGGKREGDRDQLSKTCIDKSQVVS